MIQQDIPAALSEAIHSFPTVTTLFFDLDGTISNPLRGFANSLRYACATLGYPLNATDEELSKLIGPPLRQTLGRVLSFTGTQEEQTAKAEEVLMLYRAQYLKEGALENDLYPFIPTVLQQASREYTLYVVTSKIEESATKIIDHFGLTHFFKAIYGAAEDKSLDNKADLVRHVLEQERLTPNTIIMIGDRDTDIKAAKPNGLYSIGVTYGFGSAAELKDAGADRVI